MYLQQVNVIDSQPSETIVELCFDRVRAQANICGLAIFFMPFGDPRSLFPHNINVNCIAPGLTATEGVSQWLPSRNKEDGSPVPPLEYPPDPEHVAELATFLASRSSSHISGELFPIRALTELA